MKQEKKNDVAVLLDYAGSRRGGCRKIIKLDD